MKKSQPTLGSASTEFVGAIRIFLGPGAVIASGICIGWLVAHAELDGYVFWLVELLMLASLLAYLRLATHRTGNAFTIANLTTGFYLAGFALGGVFFYLTPDSRQYTLITFTFAPADVTTALLIGWLGWFGFIVGYHATERFGNVKRFLPRFHLANPAQLVLTVLVVEAIGWGARLLTVVTGRYFHTQETGEVINSGSSAPIMFAATLPLLALALVGASRIESLTAFKNARTSRRLFLVLAVVEALWYLPSGERSRLIGVALTVIIVEYNAGTLRLPWRYIAPSALILIFGVFPFVASYRGQTGGYQADPVASLQTAWGSYGDSSLGDQLQNGLSQTFSRFSDVASVATIVGVGADNHSRAPGETLSWTFTGFVPRLIVGDKTDPGKFGNEFGRSFGITNERNYVTSVSVSQVGEMYLNFRWFGLLVGMALLGFVYMLIEAFLRERRKSAAQLAIFATLAWPLVNGMETIVAAGLMTGVKLLAVYVSVLFVADRGVGLFVQRRRA